MKDKIKAAGKALLANILGLIALGLDGLAKLLAKAAVGVAKASENVRS